LLGSEASLYFGNATGDVWTDLVKPVPKPPTDLASTLSITHYMRNGDSMMAAGRSIPGTPFFLIIEFPDRVVMGQAGHFLRRVLIIDAALLAIGLLAAFALSRSITRPLNMLTAAASGISQGSYSGLVRIHRNDELGALGNAFNAMVVRLRESQGELEQEIQERKQAEADLLKTNQRLEGALAGVQTKTEELASMTQQLWQASKLATLGELAASVAHELNNPLAIISLRLEALAMELGDDVKKSKPVETVSDEVERMGRLVGSLLEFSRRGHQQISTIDAGEEIQKSVDLIEYYLRSHRVVVTEDFEPNLPTIQADRQQLRQVFLNLLTNASDAMPGGGKLIARTRRVQLRNGARGVSIEFADAGSGISQKDLEKIWEPFFTTKLEGKGTGLGLAICRRVIEEHQGEISIQSLLDEGTTVRVCLPATIGDEQSADREHLNREVTPEAVRLDAR